MSDTQSLGELLPQEIIRNEELLIAYSAPEIPALSKALVIPMIRADLMLAHKAQAEGDVIAMLQAYEKLKGNE